jgi:hypothetical protein
MIMQSQMLQTM